MASQHPPKPKPAPDASSTVPPPYDPLEFARETERSLRISDTRATIPVPKLLDDDEVTVDAGEDLIIEEEDSLEPALDAVPCIVLSSDESRGKPLDDVARALFASIDGTRTLEELLQACGAPTATGFAIFRGWAADGRVVFRRW